MRTIAVVLIAATTSACSFLFVRPSPTKNTDGTRGCTSYALPIADLLLSPLTLLPVVELAFDENCGDGPCQSKGERIARYAFWGTAFALMVVSAGYGARSESACRQHRDAMNEHESRIRRVVALTAEATDAATSHDCARVSVLEAQVLAIDPWFHQAVFRAVPELEACRLAPQGPTK